MSSSKKVSQAAKLLGAMARGKAKHFSAEEIKKRTKRLLEHRFQKIKEG